MRSLFAFITALVWTSGVHAQEPTIATGAVQACYAQTAIGDIYPACLGDAANACQAQPGGSTTLGIVTCITAETTDWDSILNEAYTDLRQQFGARSDGATLTDSLRDAQRAWIAFRDADCGLQYDRWGGGSMRNIAASNCRMIMTASRALALRDMAGPQ